MMDRESTSRKIQAGTKYRYSFTSSDADPLFVRAKTGDLLGALSAAYDLGFYAGITCAINRGFDKKNDPRKAAAAQLKGA